MRNRVNTGASYTGTFKHLRKATLARENVMNLTINLKGNVEDISAVTSNKEGFEDSLKKRIVTQVGQAAYDPRVFTAVNNILEYRLRDCLGRSFHHGLMSLYALNMFLKESSDRYFVAISNEFLPYIDGLRNYNHQQELIQKQLH